MYDVDQENSFKLENYICELIHLIPKKCNHALSKVEMDHGKDVIITSCTLYGDTICPFLAFCCVVPKITNDINCFQEWWENVKYTYTPNRLIGNKECFEQIFPEFKHIWNADLIIAKAMKD